MAAKSNHKKVQVRPIEYCARCGEVLDDDVEDAVLCEECEEVMMRTIDEIITHHKAEIELRGRV